MIKNDQNILPDQAWFWSEYWQTLEDEAEEDIAAGRVFTFDDLESALKALERESAVHEF